MRSSGCFFQKLMDAFFKLPTFEELWWLNELPQWLSNKKFTCKCRRHRFHPWIKKIPWRRKWQPTLVFLPKKTPWTEVWRAAVCEVTKSGARLSTHTMTEWRQTWSSEPDIFLFLCLLFCDLEQVIIFSEPEFFNLLLEADERINEVVYAQCPP